MSKYKRIKTVLVVDDNLSIREALSNYLDMLGLKPIVVSNGEDATEVLNGSDVDLLITDFRMPNMDGVQLLDWCRTHNIHIPVIFMSANADLIQREQIALADCCATLMFKPINLKIFTAAIGAADSRNHHQDCIHSSSLPVK